MTFLIVPICSWLVYWGDFGNHLTKMSRMGQIGQVIIDLEVDDRKSTAGLSCCIK